MNNAHTKRAKHGFTLIEILVSISVIGVLVALTLVGLRSVRDKGESLQCLTHIRTMGNMVSLYASDNRDSFPTWTQPSRYYNANPDRWSFYIDQTFLTMGDPRWLEFTNSATEAEHMYCPASQLLAAGAYAEKASPDYELSASVFVDPKYLDEDLEFAAYSQQLGAQMQRMSSARYPSAKVGVAETFIWHGWRGVYEQYGPALADLQYNGSKRPGSVWFIDGHADQLRTSDAAEPLLRYPVWRTLPYFTTPDGIRGRDF